MSLQKIVIKAYEDKRFNRECGEFTLPINPENFSRSLQIQNDDSQAQGRESAPSKHTNTEPEEIKLEFTFDNTGTVEGNILDGTEVLTQIEDFLEVVYNIKSNTHEPCKLRLTWGAFVFDCKLTALSINYTLFKPSGNPLRAKLSATFKGYLEIDKEELKNDRSSPDLTHVRTVGLEDTLSLMTFDIYGNQKWLNQVAKANGLTSTRLLKKGQELVFPPIDKNAN